jgi:hypothetical protein
MEVDACLARPAMPTRPSSPSSRGIAPPPCRRTCGGVLPGMLVLVCWALAGAPGAASDGVNHIEFALEVQTPAAGSPFARDLWADIVWPNGERRAYPAFFDGGLTWRVRVRAVAAGHYRLDGLEERTEWEGASRPVAFTGETERTHTGPPAVPAVELDPRDPTAFRTADGRPFLPVGLNVAWSESDASFAHAFAQLAAAGGNWVRVWVVSWGETDPTWRREGTPSPAAGELDLEIARRWDRLIALAERHGLRVQIVLQQHGQYSTVVNPSWPAHPWNHANGGFLARPEDFFTDATARRHTRTKLRSFAARHGHSPAVMAWELFNEVHFTDAWKLARRTGDVVRWHEEMAAWMRRCDPHGHLVTTSAEDLASPLWRAMDFYQPHLYAVNGLAHVRRFPGLGLPAAKPVFLGEVGDDHQRFPSAEDKASGAGLMPPVWASLFVDGALPAQTWHWYRLVDTPRWPEFVAWARFVAATRLAERHGALREFLPAVRTPATVPRRLIPGFHWAARSPLTLDLAAARRPVAELADVPEYFVPPKRQLLADGHPDRLTLRLDRERAGTLSVTLNDIGVRGGRLVARLDGRKVFERRWPAYRPATPGQLRPDRFTLDVPAGRHELELRNEGRDSFRLREIDLDETEPAIAALGRRGPDCVLLYLWHRTEVMAAQPGTQLRGELVVPGLAAGRWRVTWWPMAGESAPEATEVEHAGGDLVLATPGFARHAAGWLESLR